MCCDRLLTAVLMLLLAQMFTDDLERISKKIYYNIDATIQGTKDLNLTEEISSTGLSVYYYNITLGTTGIEISPADTTCAIDTIHSILFPVWCNSMQ